MMSCADNKSPGVDGLSAEFYKLFWNYIKGLLLKSYRESLNTNSLSICQKQGVINLIPKPHKELTDLKTDKLISSDQNGFVPGRYIGVNITKIINIIEECKRHNLEGFIVNVDFEKALDCLEWSFMEKALEWFSQSINTMDHDSLQ